MSKTTPLLASEEDPPTSLSLPTEASEFERLISTVSTLQQQQQQRTPVRFPPQRTLSRRDDGFTMVSSEVAAIPTGGFQSAAVSSSCSMEWIAIVTGTCCVLHVGFVWASLSSDQWAETMLQVQVPFLDVQRIHLLDTHLDGMLEQLDESTKHTELLGALALWSTSLLIPCLFMIFNPVWIIGYVTGTTWGRPSVLRHGLEMSLRWTMTVVFGLIGAQLAGQFVVLQEQSEGITVSTAFRVCSAAATGLCSFCVGVNACCICVMILRYYGFYEPLDTGQGQRSTSTPEFLADHLIEMDGQDEEDFPSMRILEEEPAPESLRETLVGAVSAMRQELSSSKPSFLQLILVFQIGLLSVLLWVPALYAPAVQYEYNGVLSAFMGADTVHVFSLYQIPQMILNDNLAADAPFWILCIVGCSLATSLIFCPMAATLFGISTWMREPGSIPRSMSRRWLYTIHPAVGGLVMACTLLATTHLLQSATARLLNDMSLCDRFQSNLGTNCLIIVGTSLKGSWLYLIQSILLEAFICLTLHYS